MMLTLPFDAVQAVFGVVIPEIESAIFVFITVADVVDVQLPEPVTVTVYAPGPTLDRSSELVPFDQEKL